MLTVIAHHQGLSQILTLTGEFQHQTVTDAEAEILSTIAIGPAPIHLILDLTAVSFLDSGGINAIAKTRTAVHAADGSLCLVCPPDSRARYILHLTGLDEYLTLTDTLAQALTHPATPLTRPIAEPQERS